MTNTENPNIANTEKTIPKSRETMPRVVSVSLDVGDLVVLKSGSPTMTVVGVAANTEPLEILYKCVWFKYLGNVFYDGFLQTANFPYNALRKV